MTYLTDITVAYIISAPHLHKRYAYVKSQLDALSIPSKHVFEEVSTSMRRFDICSKNSNLITVTKSLKIGTERWKNPTSLTGGMPEKMLNLLYNHVAAWNQIACSKSIGLVLEDDVQIHPNIVEYTEKAINELKGRKVSWDIIWPGYCCCAPDGPLFSKHLNRHKRTGCAHSYMLQPASAKKMLQSLPNNMCHGADFFMNNLFSRMDSWNGFAFPHSLVNQNRSHFPFTTHRHANETIVYW